MRYNLDDVQFKEDGRIGINTYQNGMSGLSHKKHLEI